MKAIVFFLAFSTVAFGQLLTPTAQFDLNAGLKSNHLGKHARSYFSASPTGLTLVTIGQNTVLFSASDSDGRVLHTRSDLAAVHAHVDAALFCPDGSFWLVSSAPYNVDNKFVTANGIGNAVTARPLMGARPSGQINNYHQLDLYSQAGEHKRSVRVLDEYRGFGGPIAATASQIVFHNGEVIDFRTVVGNSFQRRTQVSLNPSVPGAIAALAPNGDLLLINKHSGNMVVIDSAKQFGSVVQLAQPHPVSAVAAGADSVYLLSDGAVLKTDLAGHIVATYQPQRSAGFLPVSLGVTGDSLYLVDKVGHAARYQLN